MRRRKDAPRRTRVGNAADAERLALEALHAESARMLEVVDDVCLRFRVGEEIRFARYLLNMVVLATNIGAPCD